WMIRYLAYPTPREVSSVNDPRSGGPAHTRRRFRGPSRDGTLPGAAPSNDRRIRGIRRPGDLAAARPDSTFSFVAECRTMARAQAEDGIGANADHAGEPSDTDAFLRQVARVDEVAPPLPFAHPIGEKLGRYRILSLIGKGGMGVVYRAEDELLRRPAALKIL